MMVAFAFHQGKLAVQNRAGMAAEAARALEAGWIGTIISSSGYSQMANPDQKEVYVSSVDLNGQVWASVVMGTMPGFVTSTPADSDEGTEQLTISSGRRGFLTYEGDPLVENTRRPNAPVGVLLMGYKNRRRYRIDGKVVSRSTSTAADTEPLSSLTVDITMAMGNCPKYLHVRDLIAEEEAPLTPAIERATALSEPQMEWISSSETFVLGTFAEGPNGGADASHRGGNPGFVQAVDERTIVFPDYKGNNLYLSLGNIAANSQAGLLFIDRQTGNVLQVSGKAQIVWKDGYYGGTSTGKYVRVEVTAVVEAKGANPLRMEMRELSPFNPALPASLATMAAGRGKTAQTHSCGNERQGTEQQTQKQQQQQHQQERHLVRCAGVVEVAKGVKSFQFKASGCAGAGDLPTWTPGQYATFSFPSAELSTREDTASKCGSIFTLTKLGGGARQPREARGDNDQQGELVMRSWTITSVCGDDSPLEITVQAKEGGVSERMHTHLRPGHLVSLTVGGDFTLPGRLGTPPGRDSKILLLSAGIGVTPMIAALRWLRQREAKRGPDSNRCLAPGHPDVVAVHATRSTDVMPFLSEVQHFATGIARSESPSSSELAPPAAAAAADADVAHPYQEEQRLRYVLAITGSLCSNSTTASAAGTGVESEVSVGALPPLSGSKRSHGDGIGGHREASGLGFSVVSGRPDATMLKREVPDITERKVFLCGPRAYMVMMEAVLKSLGVASSAIHQEEFYF